VCKTPMERCAYSGLGRTFIFLNNPSGSLYDAVAGGGHPERLAMMLAIACGATRSRRIARMMRGPITAAARACHRCAACRASCVAGQFLRIFVKVAAKKRWYGLMMTMTSPLHSPGS